MHCVSRADVEAALDRIERVGFSFKTPKEKKRIDFFASISSKARHVVEGTKRRFSVKESLENIENSKSYDLPKVCAHLVVQTFFFVFFSRVFFPKKKVGFSVRVFRFRELFFFFVIKASIIRTCVQQSCARSAFSTMKI